jgi:tetratricopeptide (TPR) repeat protein
LADEWYRTPDWSPAGQAEFERRLARARNYNRSQYLRIKGIHLREAGNVDGARTLWERVLTSTDEFVDVQRPSALEHLGDSYCDEDPDRADEFYRRLLAEYPTLNATTHTVEIAPRTPHQEAAVRRGARAAQQLPRAEDRSVPEHPVSLAPGPNRHRVRHAREGDRSAGARVALELADRGPVFPRHKDVGIVHADKAILRRLKRLAK